MAHETTNQIYIYIIDIPMVSMGLSINSMVIFRNVEIWNVTWD